MSFFDPSTLLATKLFRTKEYNGRGHRTKFRKGELREEGGGARRFSLSGGQSKKTQIGRYVALVAVRDFTAAIEKPTHSLIQPVRR